MKKPVLDEFDRWVFNTKTYVGKSVRRKYKLLKLLKYVDTRNKRQSTKRFSK